MTLGKSRRTIRIAIAASLAFLVCATLAGILVGSSSIGISDLFKLVAGEELSPVASNILFNVRFPRIAAALLAGSALAVSGALIQAVIDNPLASPNVLGINAAAGLAVLLVSSLFPGMMAVAPFAAFCGALVAALIIFVISLSTGASRLTVVLVGIALSTVFGAGMNTILIVDPDAYIGASVFLVGGLSGSLSQKLLWPAFYIFFGLLAAFLFSGKLNVLSLGNTTAHSLGMRVNHWRLGLLALASLLAGAAVSFAGLLGFVGLIVPHLVRFFVGSDNRLVVPISAVFGAAFVVFCDLCARVMFAPYELPVGIIMAFLGGPFFIFLIIRNRKGSYENF